MLMLLAYCDDAALKGVPTTFSYKSGIFGLVET